MSYEEEKKIEEAKRKAQEEFEQLERFRKTVAEKFGDKDPYCTCKRCPCCGKPERTQPWKGIL